MIKPDVKASEQRVGSHVRSDRTEDRLTIYVEGRFDFTCQREFRSSYEGSGPLEEIVVDLAATEYLDSSALGMLLVLREAGQDPRIRIINSRPTVRRILEMARFETLFSIEP